MNERARPDLSIPSPVEEPAAVAVSLGPAIGSWPDAQPRVLEFELDGRQVEIADVGDTLLGVLRGALGVTSVKDGCSPQGQCGCCTVLVDGQPRVACVTPARRVAGRRITTLDGLPTERVERWANRFCETGGSQCGFCTPGIVLRLDALEAKIADDAGADPTDLGPVRQALLAHLCRCTGWQTIFEAWAHDGEPSPVRDLAAASQRAGIEGHVPQVVSPKIALGAGGFAADTAPEHALIAVPSADGQWSVGTTLHAARTAAANVQGRRTTAEHRWPIEVPDSANAPWVATLQTTWVEPAYLETDAAWCEPGGEPSSPLANGGAFGAKQRSVVGEVAHALASQHQQPVLALFSREDAVRWGPKRPPVAGGIRADGGGCLVVARPVGAGSTIELHDAVAAVAPGLALEYVDLVGPPVSTEIRAAGWAEAAVLQRAITDAPTEVTAPNGATATARLEQLEGGSDLGISVRVRCGRVLDTVVLRSYCIGAAHMAWSWVTSEALTVDAEGVVHDLTIRSFGIVRAIDMPRVSVDVIEDDGPPINGSDAVFAAVAAEVWAATGFSSQWPTGSDGMMAT